MATPANPSSSSTPVPPPKRTSRLGKGLSSLMATPVSIKPPAPAPGINHQIPVKQEDIDQSAPAAAPAAALPAAAEAAAPPAAPPVPTATSSAAPFASPSPATPAAPQPATHDADHPASPDGRHAIRYLPLDAIRPNRSQPRQHFDEFKLQSLADSIRQDGVMQPIVVRLLPTTALNGDNGKSYTHPSTDAPASGNAEAAGTTELTTPPNPQSPAPNPHYELIAGERRWRAARLAGLTVIPAILHALDDLQAAEWALIENLQREDLNPMERARAFQSLSNHFDLNHQAIGDRVGLDRSHVANLLRLLTLSDSVQSLVADSLLSMGQARAIAAVPDHAVQANLAKRAIREGLSVRQVEHLARRLTPPAPGNGDGDQDDTSGGGGGKSRGGKVHHLADLERQISHQLGTRVSVTTGRKKGAGKMTIEFYSLDQFDLLLSKLGVTTD